jgi:hypothetical protein
MDNYITKAMRLIDDSTAGLSEQELTESRDGKWSPAQVLEHLAKAFGGSAKAFELQLQSGELQPLRALTVKDRVGIFMICKLGYFPEGRKAPERTVPSDNPPGLVTLQRIKENLERAGRALDESEKKWGSRAQIFTHPVLGPLTVSQWRQFHLTHTRHHMKQVRERAAANRAKALAKSA